MNIQGFQKLTMLDFPGHTACTVFTGGCNLRCPFCHNVPLVLSPDDEPFDENEIISYLEKRAGVLDGVAITGGEPLIQKDIAYFIRKVKSLGFLVKLDTNGFFPDSLGELINSGLVDYVAMDVKNSREKYAFTCGRENLDIAPFERSLALLKQSKTDYELRTTVIKEFHTLSDIENICRWIEGAPRYFLQAFKDSGILKEGSGTPLSEEEMLLMRDTARKYIPIVELRGI